MAYRHVLLVVLKYFFKKLFIYGEFMSKKTFKKIFSAVSAVAVAAAMPIAAVGCGDDVWTPPKNTYPYDIPQDYCRTYYEVFVRSFADGNGDGIGDLKGLINNLDYLNDGDDSTMTDLGVNGIWLMPINSSPSYHGYDITDYYSINSSYGTLDDFDELVEECNKRGIWIQMDLVLNHTSSQHPWFKNALQAARDGADPKTDPDMQRYEFVIADEKPAPNWQKVSGADGYYYLENFNGGGMPDLNLKNDEVREEIKKIVDFWLNRGVKSFRLDAVPWACATSLEYNDDNGEFWTWFNDYCNKKGAEVAEAQGWKNENISRYCYNVGEVLTTADSTINSFFVTGMSNFNYSMGGGMDVGFAGAMQTALGGYRAAVTVAALEDCHKSALERDEHALLSNFLSNHDNNRSAGYFDYNTTSIKKAAGMYLLAPGNPYIYYGEEIGAAGSGKDENKRLAFNWGDSRKVSDPSGNNYSGGQPLGSWKSQTNNSNSILTYYRNAIRLRNRFPEIGRGAMTGYAFNKEGVLTPMSEFETPYYVLVHVDNSDIAAYTCEWKGRKVLIVHNICDQTKSFDISPFSGYSVVGSLKANGGSISLNGSTLKMSAGTTAVLKAQ